MDATAQKMLKAALAQLGYSEQSGGYTKFGEWYAGHIAHNGIYADAEWCDMFTAWLANETGLTADVGQFAYTPYHAQWFIDQHAWGTTPEPGALVFFSWSGSKAIDAIQHVGIVIKDLGNGQIQTIEGNTYNGVVGEHVRPTTDVVGYGYPDAIANRLAAAHARTEAATSARANPSHAAGPAADKPAGYQGRHMAAAHAATASSSNMAATTSSAMGLAEDGALTGVLGVVLCCTLALAVGRRRAKGAVPSVQLRKHGRHHRVAPEVAETLENAEAETQPLLLGVIAAKADQQEFWGELRNLADDEELAFWSSLHTAAATPLAELVDPFEPIEPSLEQAAAGRQAAIMPAPEREALLEAQRLAAIEGPRRRPRF
jgi:hypothetical protein